MISASQLLYAVCGSPAVDGLLPTSGVCWVCGGPVVAGVPWQKWSGSNFVDQNRIRGHAGTHVCAACVFVSSRIAPVPGRPPKEGKKFGGNYRNYSHMLDADGYTNASKGEKPATLAWLRRPHRGPWFAAIADSGQKHIVPFCPVNPDGSRRGIVMFDETIVALPDVRGWLLVDDATALLTGGVTKVELETGDFTARAWSLCADAIEVFEAKWSHLRGGSWFRLAVWLAQRDENAVAVRLTAEKEAKSGRSKTKRQRDDAHVDGGLVARPASGVSRKGSKRNHTLDDARDANAERGAASTGPGGVVHDDAQGPTDRGGKHEQLPLFG